MNFDGLTVFNRGSRREKRKENYDANANVGRNERKPACRFGGAGSSDGCRIHRDEGFRSGRTQSRRIHEGSGAVDSGYCLRRSHRVLRAVPGEVTGGKSRSRRGLTNKRLIMNNLILLAASDGGGPVQEIARTFGVDWPHLIAQIISFCIVCALLYKFAYKRVLTMLEERRKQIAEGLANAEKIKTELAKIEGQRQEVLLQANAQGEKLIEEARAAAARVQEQETKKAIASAERVISKAHEAAEQDHARMLTNLKREVGRLVIQTTANVTGKILTPEDHRRLDEETAKVV